MDPIATLTTSYSRRLIGTLAQIGVGVMLLYVVAVHPPQHPVGLVFLVVFGAVLIWRARRLWRSSERAVLLTPETLEDSSGAVLCRLDEIARVERGAFAFKPSNGFVILLKDPAPRAWCPGVWWRFGKRVGVGGTISGKAARDMADMIAVMLTDRGPELLREIEVAVAERQNSGQD